jgi:hypothetical protein
MKRLVNNLVPTSALLLAVLIVCVAPSALRAETAMFRNECHSPVVVLTATLVKGVLHRDQPCLLRYGECTPALKLEADKVVEIYDGKTNDILYRAFLKASKTRRYFSIVLDPRSGERVQVICR